MKVNRNNKYAAKKKRTTPLPWEIAGSEKEIFLPEKQTDWDARPSGYEIRKEGMQIAKNVTAMLFIWAKFEAY